MEQTARLTGRAVGITGRPIPIMIDQLQAWLEGIAGSRHCAGARFGDGEMKNSPTKTGLSGRIPYCRLSLAPAALYRIVASRYRSPLGEIDIIASRGDILALIEVKARSSRREAIEAIHFRQRERLQRAARDFLARHPRFHRHNIRFDVMLVAPRRWPVHIKDAWWPEI